MSIICHYRCLASSRAHARAYVRVCVYSCGCACVRACEIACVRTYVCLSVCMRVCSCICACASENGQQFRQGPPELRQRDHTRRRPLADCISGGQNLCLSIRPRIALASGKLSSAAALICLSFPRHYIVFFLSFFLFYSFFFFSFCPAPLPLLFILFLPFSFLLSLSPHSLLHLVSFPHTFSSPVRG